MWRRSPPGMSEADQDAECERLFALEDATWILPIGKPADAVAKLRAVAIMVERGNRPDDPQREALIDVVDWLGRD